MIRRRDEISLLFSSLHLLKKTGYIRSVGQEMCKKLVDKLWPRDGSDFDFDLPGNTFFNSDE